MAEMGSQVTVDWYSREVEASPGFSAKYVNGHFGNVHNDATQLAIQHLFIQPWFLRLWVWQEILLAKFAIVVCGTACLPWSTFTAATLLHSKPTEVGY
jgi:hypothetical protein